MFLVPPRRQEPEEALDTDAAVPARLGWWVVIAGLGMFVAWSSLAPLDKGVPLSGTVTVAGNRKAVQHLTGGTVEAILVKEGDQVKAGDPLVRMNAVHQKANADALRVQYLGARATVARLVAERDGLRSIDMPAELHEVQDDPRVATALRTQMQLFTIATGRPPERTGRAGRERRRLAAADPRPRRIARGQARPAQAGDGAARAGSATWPRRASCRANRVLELERTHSELQTAIGEEASSMARVERQVAELRMRRLQRQQEFQKEVGAHLAEAQKEAEGLGSKLVALDHDLANVIVRAPVAGTVVSMNIFTHGGVVQPGHRLMDIVPDGEPLESRASCPCTWSTRSMPTCRST